MLVGGGVLLLGVLWIAGHALSLIPSLALSRTPGISTAATMSAQAPNSGQAASTPAAEAGLVTAQAPQNAQNNPAAPGAQNTPPETPAATTGGNSATALPPGAEAMAEDTDGTPLPQRRFLVEARTDPIFGAEPDQALVQEAESATTAQAAAPDRPSVRRVSAAPSPRRHVARTRARPRSHVSRRPPSLRRALRQVNPLRVLRVGGLRVF
jgi:hypothetical protein